MDGVATKLSLSDKVKRLIKAMAVEAECSSDPLASESPVKQIPSHCCEQYERMDIHRAPESRESGTSTSSDSSGKCNTDVKPLESKDQKFDQLSDNNSSTKDSSLIVTEGIIVAAPDNEMIISSDTTAKEHKKVHVSSPVKSSPVPPSSLTVELLKAPLPDPNRSPGKRLSTDYLHADVKRQRTDSLTESECTECGVHVKCCRRILQEQTPLFFYILNKRKIAGVDLPK